MDIIKLQKKSILIPTPWQSEQEYLGQYLMQNKLAFCTGQENFSLEKALAAAAAFEYQVPAMTGDRTLPEKISDWLHQSLKPALG